MKIERDVCYFGFAMLFADKHKDVCLMLKYYGTVRPRYTFLFINSQLQDGANTVLMGQIIKSGSKVYSTRLTITA